MKKALIFGVILASILMLFTGCKNAKYAYVQWTHYYHNDMVYEPDAKYEEPKPELLTVEVGDMIAYCVRVTRITEDYIEFKTVEKGMYSCTLRKANGEFIKDLGYAGTIRVQKGQRIDMVNTAILDVTNTEKIEF